MRHFDIQPLMMIMGLDDRLWSQDGGKGGVARVEVSDGAFAILGGQPGEKEFLLVTKGGGVVIRKGTR